MIKEEKLGHLAFVPKRFKSTAQKICFKCKLIGGLSNKPLWPRRGKCLTGYCKYQPRKKAETRKSVGVRL